MFPMCLLLEPPRPQRISLGRGFEISVFLLFFSWDAVVGGESLTTSDSTPSSLLLGEADVGAEIVGG